MARTNMTATRVKPEDGRLLTLDVVRRETISRHFARVTLGGGDIDRFTPMGFDQWFRLFLPVSESSLSRLPSKLDTIAYMKYLAIAKTDRPVLRNYSVRAYRAHGASGGPELDVDFVIHGSASEGTAGPAATWAQRCSAGDAVAILDEGIAYSPHDGVLGRTVLVADETGVPAAAGILESMPRTGTGLALLEIPDADDVQTIEAPEGVEVRWIVRDDPHSVPGVAALEALAAQEIGGEPFYGWAVGEQSLASGARRHWVRHGVPKGDIAFCGYWKSATKR